MVLTSQAILDWIDATIPRGVDFITIFAAIALLFASFEFFRQYKARPKRRMALYLFVFFLIDGLDYLIFSLGGSRVLDYATATLIGMILDAGVAAASLVFIFSKTAERAIRKDDCNS